MAPSARTGFSFAGISEAIYAVMLLAVNRPIAVEVENGLAQLSNYLKM